MNFKTWCIEKYSGKNSPEGDFARDLKSDSNFPHDSNSVEIIGSYLYMSGACDEAINVFKNLWNDYQIPQVEPIDFDNIYWIIICPYCGDKHRHGNTKNYGKMHRLSHCIGVKSNDNSGYDIIWNKEIEQKILASKPVKKVLRKKSKQRRTKLKNF
jgi:uncharacterized protein YozE (UPF0346 family)